MIRRARPLGCVVIVLGLGGAVQGQIERRMRVFDLGFLLEPTELNVGLLPRPPGIRAGTSGSSSGEIVIGEESASARPWLNAEDVQAAIRTFVMEDTWRNRRNRLEASEDALVVVHTPSVLETIERLLGVFERRSSRAVLLELALVPPEAMDEAAPGWSRTSSSPWHDGEIFDRALKAAGRSAHLSSGQVRVGAWKRLPPRSLSHHLEDYEVNQTGVIPTINPRVRSTPYGVFGEALVLPSPDGKWWRVDLRMGEARIGGEPERRTLPYGDIEFVRRADFHIGTTVIVPENKVAVLGAFRHPSSGESESGKSDDGVGRPRELVGLVRVVGRAGEGDRRAGDKDLPELVDVGFLLEPRTYFPLDESGEFDEEAAGAAITFADEADDEPIPSLITADFLMERLRQELPESLRADRNLMLLRGTLFLQVPDEISQAVRRTLGELARRYTRTLQIDVHQLSVTADQLAEAGGVGSVLDAEWLENVATSSGLRSRVVGLSGWDVTLCSSATKAYMRDVEYVSGGTANHIVDKGDPIVGSVGEGFLLTAKAEMVPGTRWTQVRIRGESARPPVFERQARSRMNQSLSSTAADGGKAKPAAKWLLLDLPDEDTDRWEHVVTLSLGDSILVNALPDTTRAGRVRIMILTVNAFTMNEKRF